MKVSGMMTKPTYRSSDTDALSPYANRNGEQNSNPHAIV